MENDDVKQKIAYFNHLLHQENISNLPPANVYFGRGHAILLEHERIKRDTINT